MITFWQKLRLWWRGAERRREARDREFVTKNSWSGQPAQQNSAATVRAAHTPAAEADREGLQAAYLDQSGKIDYYLEWATGEVVEVRDATTLEGPQYRRVPRRTPAADEEDRRMFAATLASPAREKLAGCQTASDFRRELAGDRSVERAWFLFRNDRANEAISRWLSESG
jgi:hypothetical protein